MPHEHFELSVENNSEGCWFILKPKQAPNIIQYQLNMLAYNNFKGIAPLHVRTKNGENLFYYELAHGFKPVLAEYAGGTGLPPERLSVFLEKILDTLSDSRKLLLEERQFLLEQDYIFADSSGEPCLLYYPAEIKFDNLQRFQHLAAQCLISSAINENAGFGHSVERLTEPLRTSEFSIGLMREVLSEYGRLAASLKTNRFFLPGQIQNEGKGSLELNNNSNRNSNSNININGSNINGTNINSPNPNYSNSNYSNINCSNTNYADNNNADISENISLDISLKGILCKLPPSIIKSADLIFVVSIQIISLSLSVIADHILDSRGIPTSIRYPIFFAAIIAINVVLLAGILNGRDKKSLVQQSDEQELNGMQGNTKEPGGLNKQNDTNIKIFPAKQKMQDGGNPHNLWGFLAGLSASDGQKEKRKDERKNEQNENYKGRHRNNSDHKHQETSLREKTQYSTNFSEGKEHEAKERNKEKEKSNTKERVAKDYQVKDYQEKNYGSKDSHAYQAEQYETKLSRPAFSAETTLLCEIRKKAWLKKNLTDHGSEAEINKSRFIIGRNPETCDMVIPVKTVGRVHAEIINRDMDFFIIDRESKNGTFVNGQKLKNGEEMKLCSGDSIAFSEEKYFFIL